MRKLSRGIAWAALGWVLSPQTACFADPLYTITNLTTSPVSISATNGDFVLNNQGQVAGYMPPGPNWQQGYGFVYDGSPGGSGAVTPVGGSLDPVNYPAVRNTQPTALTDSGQILGNDNPPVVGGTIGYYVYSNGQVTSLPFAPAGINNAGQIIGSEPTTNPSFSAFIYNPATGTQQFLGTLPGTTQSYATAINNAGQVVGDTSGPSGQAHPFLYSNGKLTDLGTLGGTSAGPTAINDSGQVVGWSYLTNSLISHAFLYANGKMTDLGTLPGYQNSFATSINSLGQVVGYAAQGSSATSWIGFLYSNGVMTNLNSLIDPKSGWTILEGLQINNLGQILAYASNSSSAGYLLLTPSDLAAPGDPVYPTIVPEPSSLAVYGMIGVGLAVRLLLARRGTIAPTVLAQVQSKRMAKPITAAKTRLPCKKQV